MNVLLSILLVVPLVTLVFLLLAIVLIWGFGRLSFREFPASILEMDQPCLPEWAIRGLTAAWPIELIFACILAPSIAAVVLHDSNLVRLIGIAMLVGAFAYLLVFILLKMRGGGGWAPWPGDFGSGTGCELLSIGLVVALVFGLVAVVYYGLTVAICRRFILPIVFQVAGISTARIPPLFTRKSGRDSEPDRAVTTPNRATADVDQTVQLNPNDAWGYHNRGFAYYKQGNLNRAIADYDRVIELQPDYAKVYLLRGLAYQQQGRRDKAIADYRKALEFSKDSEGRAIAKDALQTLGAK